MVAFPSSISSPSNSLSKDSNKGAYHNTMGKPFGAFSIVVPGHGNPSPTDNKDVGNTLR